MKRFIAAVVACGVLGVSAPAVAETQEDVIVGAIFDEIERAILRDYGQTEDAVRLYKNQKGHYRGPDHVPPGHMPAPGQCRAWVFGEPPGHQAPAGDCATIAANLPANASLIYGGAAQGTRLPMIFGASLPDYILDEMPRREDTERVVVDDDVVLIQRSTRLILDVLSDVIRQN